MKLLQEIFEDVQYIKEDTTGTLYIKGVFLMGKEKNRNGRIYPMDVLGNSVASFNENYVIKNRAVGELNHPATPTINLDRLAILVTELTLEGSDYIGKARVLKNQPCGAMLHNLIEEGIQIGVSSRGTGTIKKSGGADIVESNFRIAAVDAVHDPSAYKAFVDSVMENVDWVYDLSSDSWKAQQVLEQIKREGDKSSALLESNALKWFNAFTHNLSYGKNKS